MGGDAGAGGAVEGKISISGKVVDEVSGLPIGGVGLVVDGQSVTSAQDGTFSAVATPPYDLVMLGRPGGSGIFLGVTRSDPTVRTTAIAARQGAIQGKVTGATPGGNAWVFLASKSFETRRWLIEDDNNYDSGANGGSNEIAWYGAGSPEAVLLALQTNPAGQTAAERISAWAKKPLTVTPGLILNSPEADLMLGRATLRDLEVTIAQPDGPPDSCSIKLGMLEGVDLQTLSCAPLTFTLEVPDLPEIPLHFMLEAKHEGRPISIWQRIAGDAESVSMVVPRRFPSLSAPAPGAALPANQVRFDIAPAAGSISLLVFCWGAPPAVSCGELVTGDMQLSLARVLSHGIALPPNVPIQLSIEALADVATMDDYLDPDRDPRALVVRLSGSPDGQPWREFAYTTQ
jgi:hypothetical protein